MKFIKAKISICIIILLCVCFISCRTPDCELTSQQEPGQSEKASNTDPSRNSNLTGLVLVDGVYYLDHFAIIEWSLGSEPGHEINDYRYPYDYSDQLYAYALACNYVEAEVCDELEANKYEYIHDALEEKGIKILDGYKYSFYYADSNHSDKTYCYGDIAIAAPQSCIESIFGENAASISGIYFRVCPIPAPSLIPDLSRFPINPASQDQIK